MADSGRFGLVLGAGGLAGLAYHAGVLLALHCAGLDPAEADVIVGTSAGSVIGSMLRLGLTTEDIAAYLSGASFRAGHEDVELLLRTAPPAPSNRAPGLPMLD